MDENPAPDLEPDESTVAVRTLAAMGPAGRAVLRELDRSGAVRSPMARGELRAMAAQGYRPVH